MGEEGEEEEDEKEEDEEKGWVVSGHKAVMVVVGVGAVARGWHAFLIKSSPVWPENSDLRKIRNNSVFLKRRWYINTFLINLGYN